MSSITYLLLIFSIVSVTNADFIMYQDSSCTIQYTNQTNTTYLNEYQLMAIVLSDRCAGKYVLCACLPYLKCFISLIQNTNLASPISGTCCKLSDSTSANVVWCSSIPSMTSGLLQIDYYTKSATCDINSSILDINTIQYSPNPPHCLPFTYVNSVGVYAKTYPPCNSASMLTVKLLPLMIIVIVIALLF
jgi:hypothetical protein